MFSVDKSNSTETSSRSLGSMIKHEEREFAEYIDHILPKFDNASIETRLEEVKKAFEIFDVDVNLKIALTRRVRNFPKISFFNPYILAAGLLIHQEKGSNIDKSTFDEKNIIMERLSFKFFDNDKKKQEDRYPFMVEELLAYLIELLKYIETKNGVGRYEEDDED